MSEKSKEDTPVFIAGTNGSRTRVYATLLELAGVFQGSKKNYAFEPENIIQYTKPLVPKLMALTRAPTYDVNSLPSDFRMTMETWIKNFAEEIRAESPQAYSHWGWKHPRNLFLAPLLHQVFPHCYFIQVIRDGRDMAFADNKGDARTLFRSLIGPADLQPQDYVRFWSKINCEVAQWCEINMGTRFIWSRFEDLCLQPHAELQRIINVMGLSLKELPLNKCNELVESPSSIGRWRNASKNMQDKLYEAGEKGLHQFNYVNNKL